MQCIPVNERIIVATLKTAITPLTIVQVYAPTDGSEADAKDAFYAQLQHQLRQIPEANMLLLMGVSMPSLAVRQNSGVGPLAGLVFQHASQTMAGASSPCAWSPVLQWLTPCSNTNQLTYKHGTIPTRLTPPNTKLITPSSEGVTQSAS